MIINDTHIVIEILYSNNDKQKTTIFDICIFKGNNSNIKYPDNIDFMRNLFAKKKTSQMYLITAENHFMFMPKSKVLNQEPFLNEIFKQELNAKNMEKSAQLVNLSGELIDPAPEPAME